MTERDIFIIGLAITAIWLWALYRIWNLYGFFMLLACLITPMIILAPLIAVFGNTGGKSR